MIMNLPANAGGHGFDPWAGMIPHVMRQLSSCANLLKPVHLLPQFSNKRSHHNERPTHCNWSVGPAHCNERKPPHSKKDPAQPKIDKFIILKKKKSGSQDFTCIKPSLHPPS